MSRYQAPIDAGARPDRVSVINKANAEYLAHPELHALCSHDAFVKHELRIVGHTASLSDEESKLLICSVGTGPSRRSANSAANRPDRTTVITSANSAYQIHPELHGLCSCEAFVEDSLRQVGHAARIFPDESNLLAS